MLLEIGEEDAGFSAIEGVVHMHELPSASPILMCLKSVSEIVVSFFDDLTTFGD